MPDIIPCPPILLVCCVAPPPFELQGLNMWLRADSLEFARSWVGFFPISNELIFGWLPVLGQACKLLPTLSSLLHKPPLTWPVAFFWDLALSWLPWYCHLASLFLLYLPFQRSLWCNGRWIGDSVLCPDSFKLIQPSLVSKMFITDAQVV